jgi:phosphonoacetaldehyde hydrolase
MIKAVIFDWAGTVIDYGCMAPTAVFVEVFHKKGIELSFEEARGPMGMAKIDHVRELLKIERVSGAWEKLFQRLPDESDVIKLYSQLEPELTRIVLDYYKLIPGVKDLVKELRSKGIKIGSTTGYVKRMMTDLVPKAVEQGFTPDSIVCSSEVPAGRPAPWGIYLNAQRMNAYPLSQMVKIGDTIADIREGLNADMWTIACTQSGNEIGLTEEQVEALDKDDLNLKLKKAENKFLDAGAHYVVKGIWECLPVLDEIEKRIKDGEKPGTIN